MPQLLGMLVGREPKNLRADHMCIQRDTSRNECNACGRASVHRVRRQWADGTRLRYCVQRTNTRVVVFDDDVIPDIVMRHTRCACASTHVNACG